MLVDNSVYKNSYNGTGTTTEFPITFPFLENEHIQVIQSTDNGITESEVPSSDYTISGAGLESGGTCTFKVAPQAGVLIIIRRNVPITQLYAYKELDNFPAESHENALAKLTMIDQQQQEQINRALKVSGASQQSPEELMDELFQIRDDSEAAQSAAEAAQSAAEAAQSAAEDCRDTACECASQAQNTLDNAVQVIQNQESISRDAVIAQEQASVTTVQTEGNTQAKRLEDIAKTILISAASYNKSVSVKLTSAITSGETYTLPESMAYLVGRSQLLVSGNGVWFYKDFQYNEVGTDGVTSMTIKFLQDLAIDDVLTFTILANRVNVLTATNSGLVNDVDGYIKLNVDGQTVLINASGQVYVPVMVGATADNAGTAGLAPTPSIGDQNKPLTGGGKYADSIDCNVVGDITGRVYLVYDGKVLGSCFATSDSHGTRINFDTYEENDKGAYLELYKGSSAKNPGSFNLAARNSDSSVVKTLIGTILGSLKWSGKEVVRSINDVLADSSGNVALSSDVISSHNFVDAGGYIKYKSGLCIQWGFDRNTSDQYITCRLIIPFINDIYWCNATICFSGPSAYNYNPEITTRTTTTFIFNTNIAKAASCFWLAIGKYK